MAASAQRAACVLLHTSDATSQREAGATLQAFLLREGIPLTSLDMLTEASALAAKDAAGPSYGMLLVLGRPGRNLASAVGPALQAGARLYVQSADEEDAQLSSRDLLMAGYTGVEVLPVAGPVGQVHLVVGTKPTWSIGAKASLSLKPKAAPAAAAAQAATLAVAAAKPPASAAPAEGTWRLNAGSLNAAGEDEIMDEGELPTEAVMVQPAAAPAAVSAGCEVSAGRQACANCTCGRAEAEAAGVKFQLTQEMLDNPVSACGSCSLGDAFRCAGCPYRGLPAFEPGQKITLGADFLTADA